MTGGPARDGKGFASLGSALLARKGAARPAMRPQGYVGGNADDLGWNDMGDAPVDGWRTLPAPLPLTPMTVEADDKPPAVLRQIEEIEQAFAAPAPAPAPAPAAAGRKTAFTLRLDAERHLRLRLACAVEHRSAQQIVTRALDALLAAMPDTSRLAASLPPRTRRDD